MPTSAPRFIGYVRVSTAEQADSGLGLDAQEHAIREACERRGLDLIRLETDAGRSGANLKRPAITRALRAIARGQADGLIVAKLDRVSRSSTDTAILVDWLANDARADFVALDLEWADTTSAMGKLLLGIVSHMAEWERDLTAQRTRAALARLRAQGKPTGPGAVSDQGQLAVRVRRMRDQGATLSEIASTLNREGVPTPRGGTTWRPSSLQTVLGYKRPPKRRARASMPRVSRGGRR